MIHRKCRKELELNIGAMYTLRSPGIQISPKGIFPGTIEVTNSGKKIATELHCRYCDKDLATKDEFEAEVMEKCVICEEYHAPSDILVTEYVPTICKKCANLDESTAKKLSPVKNAYFNLYAEILGRPDNLTLLTILMKK